MSRLRAYGPLICLFLSSAPAGADLSITKSAGPTWVTIGDTVQYTLCYGNTSGGAFYNAASDDFNFNDNLGGNQASWIPRVGAPNENAGYFAGGGAGTCNTDAGTGAAMATINSTQQL